MPLGITSCLYINTAMPSLPTWALADLISDNKVNAQWNEGESSVRRGRVQTFEPTNLALALEGKIRKDMSDAAFLAIRAASNAGALIDVLVLDGPIGAVGSEGVRFMGHVFNFGEDQSLGVVTFKDFSIKPSIPITGYDPKVAVTTGGGAVSFTPFGS